LSGHSEKMDHGYFQDRLSAYLDSELTPEEMAALAQHLEECAGCRERLEALRRLDTLVEKHSGLGESEYWEQLALRIEKRLEAQPEKIVEIRPEKRRRFTGMWWKVPALAASVILVGYIGLYEGGIIHEDLIQPESEPPTVVDKDEAANVVKQEERLDEAREGAGYVAGAPEAEPREEPGAVQSAGEDEVAEPTAKVGAPKPIAPPGSEVAEQLAQEEAAQVKTTAEEDVVTAPMLAPSPAVPGAPEIAATDTANYRTRGKGERQATAAVTPVPDELTPSPEFAAEPGLDTVQADLERWRMVRDSMQTLVLAKKEKTDELAGALKPMVETAPSLVDKGRRPKQAATVAARPESRLIEAWYWIARLSSDSAEVSRCRACLDSVAVDLTSPSHDSAKSCLERLGP
jgi:hypothetical protein